MPALGFGLGCWQSFCFREHSAAEGQEGWREGRKVGTRKEGRRKKGMWEGESEGREGGDEEMY